MSSKSKGTHFENRVKGFLEGQGWVVCRAPASIGAFDLMAMQSSSVALLPVPIPNNRNAHTNLKLLGTFVMSKSLISVKCNWADFRPHDRKELWRVAKQAGAIALLCWRGPKPRCVPQFKMLEGGK